MNFYIQPCLDSFKTGLLIVFSIRSSFQVNNTDAEGRLTLADALVYACNQGVDKVSLMLIYWQPSFFNFIITCAGHI